MKKLFLLAVFAVTSFCAYAQNDSITSEQAQSKIDSLQNALFLMEAKEQERAENEHIAKIWKQKKHISLGYIIQNLKNKSNADAGKYKSKVGFALVAGRTYKLHKNPIANILRIGFDWNYIDLNFAKYKDGSGISIDIPSVDDYDYNDYDYDDDVADIDLGVYQLEYGMGFGPSIQVAPFYHVGKGFEYIKFYTYFHVTPSYSAIIESVDDETNFNSGYCTFFNWGIGVSYKVISVGFETRWGSAKYDMAEVDDSEGMVSGDKQKFKTTTSRIFLRFNL